jgi:hypothetical protein
MAWHNRYQKGRARDPGPTTKVERPSKYGVEPYVSKLGVRWFMAATDVLTSVTQVRVAVLLFRRWIMADAKTRRAGRKGDTAIPASKGVMSFETWEPPPGIRKRTLKLLEEAGLIRLVQEGAGRAYRVKVLQPHTDGENED